MPKSNHKKKPEASPETKIKTLFAIHPWSCRPIVGGTEIEAYVEAAGDWQTVAEIKQNAFIDTEQTAHFIAKAVNDYERNRQLIIDMVAALELCMKCPGLTWEAEHEAQILIARAKNK